MQKKNNRLLGIFLAGIMTVSAFGMPAVMPKTETSAVTQTIQAHAARGRLYNQLDPKWKEKKYYYGGTGDTLYNSGCGLFSLANAIYALNGRKVNMDNLATWASSKGYYRPGSGGTFRDPFYPQATAVYGSVYRFTSNGGYWGNVTDTRLMNWVASGKVAVIHVSGHFMAMTGYNPKTKKYRVIESAVSSTRSLPAESWVTPAKLMSGKSNVDWYYLIKNAGPVTYFPQYTGDTESLIAALQAVGAESSYSYRGQIYVANGFTDTFSGKAEQNLAMLALLKQGKLIKP